MALSLLSMLFTLACFVFLIYFIRKMRKMNRQHEAQMAEVAAVLKHEKPTSHREPVEVEEENAAADAGGTSTTSTGLTTCRDVSPLNKEQFLLAVRLYAEAQARYDTLIYHSRCDLVAMTEQQAAALVAVRTSYKRGSTLYGSGEVYIKYPDVSPAEFIEAFDASYQRSVNATVNAIMAASVAATH